MKYKIFIAVLYFFLLCIRGLSQTTCEQDRILQLHTLYNLAEKSFLASQYDLCEKYLNDYSSLFVDINNTTPGIVSAAWMCVPCAMMGKIEEKHGNIDAAIQYYEIVCKISSQYVQDLYAGGMNDEAYIGLYCALRDLYVKGRRYDDALVLSQAIVTFCHQNLQERLAVQLGNLAQAYLNLKDYDNAIKCFIEALPLFVSGEQTDENIDAFYVHISGLLTSYYFRGEYRKVLACKDKYKDYINANAEKHQNEIYCLNNIIVKSYYQLDLFEKAFQETFNLVSFAYHAYGEYSVEHANQVNNLAQLYVAYYEVNNKPEYLQLAQQQYRYVGEIWNHISGKEISTDYATFLNNYGLLYSSLQKYGKAEKFYNKALSIHERISTIDAMIATSINLGTALLNQEKKEAAEAIYWKALDLCNTDSLRYAIYRMNIYRLLSSLYLVGYSDIQGAEKFANYALGISFSLTNNIGKAKVLESVAQIYEQMGNYQQSFDLYYQAIEMKLDLDLPIAPYEWLFLAENISHHQETTDSYDAVIVACRSALAEIHEDDGLKAKALDLLGNAYMQRGEYETAKPLIYEAMQIRKDVDGIHSRSYESSLSSLVLFYTLIGDYQLAERYALDAVSINKDMANLNNLVMVEYVALRKDMIERYLPIFYMKSIEQIKSLFFFLDERQRAIFVNSEKQALDKFASIAYRFRDSDISARFAYNAELVLKGLLLNTTTQIRHIVENSNDAKLRQCFSELLKLQHDLSKESDSARYNRLLYRISQVEKELQKKIVSEGENFTEDINLTWEDVQTNLSTNSVAIEFVEYYKDLVGDDDTILYAALVLRKDWDEPKLIPLCSMDDLEQLGRFNLEDVKWRKNSFARRELDARYFRRGYSFIWSKLEPYINEGDNVYFSPSGLLHQINVEVLKDSTGRQMNEKYNVYRVSSTRQLCVKKQEVEYRNAVLYGGLIYEIDSSQMAMQSHVYQLSEDSIADRVFIADTCLRVGWKYLPATKAEVEMIARQMYEHQIQSERYTGTLGTEESFKALSGAQAQIIHLATHGFFLENEVARKQNYSRIFNMGQSIDIEDNSLKRSGLILAGGQRAWLKEQIPVNVEDGILWADEIATMDLLGTDLVVLSACQTGLGEITSEGVFGLQRAFKKAGVQTLIMSLWRVNDEATSLMMQTFYEHLLSGKTKREAFVVAQQVVKEKYIDPYYWAAFIMLD